MEDNPNSKRNIDEKFWISISSIQQLAKIPKKEKERKREEKNQIKEKGNNLMYFVLRLITKAFSRKSLVKFSPRRHKRLIALNFKGFKFYSVNRCEMNFRENETKRYFQKNFLPLSLSFILNVGNVVSNALITATIKLARTRANIFCSIMREILTRFIFWLTRYYYKGLKRELIIFINWKTVPLQNIFIYKILPFLSKEFQISTK